MNTNTNTNGIVKNTNGNDRRVEGCDGRQESTRGNTVGKVKDKGKGCIKRCW